MTIIIVIINIYIAHVFEITQSDVIDQLLALSRRATHYYVIDDIDLLKISSMQLVPRKHFFKIFY